jgi:hypothetical protein
VAKATASPPDPRRPCCLPSRTAAAGDPRQALRTIEQDQAAVVCRVRARAARAAAVQRQHIEPGATGTPHPAPSGLEAFLPLFTASLPPERAARPPPAVDPVNPLGSGSAAYSGLQHPNLSRAGTVRDLFRKTARALRRPDDSPKSRQRRRRGETDGQFRQLMRRLMRRLDLRPQFRHAASRTGRRSSNPPTSAQTLRGPGAPPWSNPLNGIDFYAGDLAGFADSDAGPESGLQCNNWLEH